MKTTSSPTLSKSHLLNTISCMNDNGGPEVAEYSHIDNCMNSITQMMEQNIISANDIEAIKKECDFLASTQSVMGHIKLKPFGYAGDYLIIDRIYQKQLSSKYSKWDHYSMHTPAAEAVRNRKQFFKTLIQEKLKTNDTIRLLNVASGPARDLKEIFDEIDPTRLQVTCVEMDERAIAHAKTVCSAYLGQITFVNQNVFKFRTDEKFDLVWSAGLFDYFTDKLFVKLITTFRTFLHKNGEIVIGNFSKDNPGRTYMEVFGEWFLNHRSAEELTNLAVQARACRTKVSVDKECLGINLFLRISDNLN